MRARSHARAVAAFVAVLVTLGLSACSPATSDRPLIVVSTNILGDVVDELVGDDITVLTLMRPNADPHSFEISARDAAEFRRAELIVSNGLGLEEGLQHHLDAAAEAGVPMFAAGEAIDALEYSEGDAMGTLDPHFWTDPQRMTDVVAALHLALADVPGMDLAELTRNVDRYLAELDQLDADMSSAFDTIPPAQRALVTNHHVFGYLADRFDFTVVGAAIPGGTTLAAPSASDLADLVGAVERHGVAAIFAESSAPDRLMRALADEAEVHVEVIELFTESLTEPDGGAPDYLTMMRANTERITTGLAP